MVVELGSSVGVSGCLSYDFGELSSVVRANTAVSMSEDDDGRRVTGCRYTAGACGLV